MALVSAVCPECKERIKVDDSKAICFCLNCGAKIDTTIIEKKPKTTRKKSTNATASKTAISATETVVAPVTTVPPIVQNYIELATSAIKAGNNELCETYCNKVIEIDSTNSAVWALKAAASGWQTSLTNIRVEEMLIYFGNAVKYSVSESQAEIYRDMAKEELTKVLLAIFDLQCNRFIRWTDEDESNAFLRLHLLVISSAVQYLSNMVSGKFDVADVLKAAATKVDICCVNAESAVMNEYEASDNGYPRDYSWNRLLEKMGYCRMVYRAAADMAKDCDDDMRITCLENIINNANYCLSSCSYDDYLIGDTWHKYKNHVLSQDSINYYRREISQCKADIRQTEQDKRKRKLDAYWAEHAEEKEKLVAELKQLESEADELEKQLKAIDRMEDIVELRRTLSKLQNERKMLGVFKLKEKRTKDEEINTTNAKLTKLLDDRRAPIVKEHNKILSRIETIDNELNRDR